MSRLPDLDREHLSAEQQRVYDKIAGGPRAKVGPMFLTLMHAPELADRIQQLGEYMRYGTCYPDRLSELAALITAKHYNSDYIWESHAPKALKFGLAAETIAAIRGKRRPAALQADEINIFEFTTELLNSGKVSDAVYQRTVKEFGARGAIELGVIIGYYIMIAMTVLAHEVPPASE
jgi:4-carboxymuconolactone decarboxylase